MTVDRSLELLGVTRKNILALMDDCSLEQLTEIPSGFNNHLLWNAGHILATEQILIYASAGTPYSLDSEFVDGFKKGSFPADAYDAKMVEQVKELMISQVERTKADYEAKVFGTYEQRTTSYGVTLTSVEDAIFFLNLHESMHLGQMKMLKKLI